MLGLVNAALPFTLIAWGQTHIHSGVAAITVATVPIFVVLLAGLAPVGGLAATVDIIASTAGSLCYAASALYIQIRLGGA